VLTSDPLNPAQVQETDRHSRRFIRRALLVRTWGDCYGYLLLASGWADFMCDPSMNPWDIQALGADRAGRWRDNHRLARRRSVRRFGRGASAELHPHIM